MTVDELKGATKSHGDSEGKDLHDTWMTWFAGAFDLSLSCFWPERRLLSTQGPTLMGTSPSLSSSRIVMKLFQTTAAALRRCPRGHDSTSDHNIGALPYLLLLFLYAKYAQVALSISEECESLDPCMLQPS